MTDTITIPDSIPREIQDGDKTLKVVGLEIRPSKRGEYFWDNDRWIKAFADFHEYIKLTAITQPVPRYIYPTPVEACRMIADAGGPIECQVDDCGEWKDASLRCVDVFPDEALSFYVTIDYEVDWYEKIRVLQPE